MGMKRADLYRSFAMGGMYDMSFWHRQWSLQGLGDGAWE